MAPKTPPPPGQAFQDALDPALLSRLRRRAERPGLARPWQAQAMLARHRRMVGGLPLAELLLRRAEILADERAAWAPIVYARPAAPGPDRPPAIRAGAPGASPAAAPAGMPPRPVVRATARRTAPRPPGSPPAPNTTPAASDGAAQGVRPRQAAAAPPSAPIHPERAEPRSPWGTQAEAVAAFGAVPPGPAAAARATAPELPVVARPAPARPAARRDRGAAPLPTPNRPVVEPVRTARPPTAPGLALVTAAAPPQQAPLPGGTPPGGTSSSLPVVRPGPGRNGDRPVPWAPDAQTRRGGPPALPVVGEQVMRASGPNRAWAAPAGVPASLPFARAAGVPAAPTAPSAPPAVPQPPPPGPATRAAARPVPAARGAEADRARGPGARPQRVVLAPVEVDRVADKVQRKLLHRLAIEAERRGKSR
jgi:hypothetical protein